MEIRSIDRKYAIVYALFSAIEKKIEKPDEIIEKFKNRFLETGYFVPSGKNLKWIIDRDFSPDVTDKITNLFIEFAKELQNQRLKE